MVEEHRSAHGLTQRRFDLESTGEPRSPPPSEDEPPAPRVSPVPGELPAPRGPSGVGLRDRQLRWLRERARFEASHASAPSNDVPEQ